MKIARDVDILLAAALFAGQLTATADEVEIKFVVKEAQVEKAIQALGLDAADAEKKTA